jgi:hypothetical protein
MTTSALIRVSSVITETINENFYEMYNLIEETTEKYDHKRGHTSLKAELSVKVGDLRGMTSTSAFVGNPLNYWTAEVNTPKGTLSFTVKD